MDLIKPLLNAEAVVRRCYVEKVFLKFLQSLQENTYGQVWGLQLY